MLGLEIGFFLLNSHSLISSVPKQAHTPHHFTTFSSTIFNEVTTQIPFALPNSNTSHWKLFFQFQLRVQKTKKLISYSILSKFLSFLSNLFTVTLLTHFCCDISQVCKFKSTHFFCLLKCTNSDIIFAYSVSEYRDE